MNQNIDNAINAQRIPRRGASGRTTIATGHGDAGRGYLVLARPDGSLTPAGQYYYEQTGQQRPDARFDRNQALIHRGTGDYIRTRRGEQLVRRLMPDGTMRITALGRTFFRHRHTEYVVHMPVIIRGTRANGRAYERRDYLPVESLGLGQILESQGLTHERAAARVRSKVLAVAD